MRPPVAIDHGDGPESGVQRHARRSMQHEAPGSFASAVIGGSTHSPLNSEVGCVLARTTSRERITQPRRGQKKNGTATVRYPSLGRTRRPGRIDETMTRASPLRVPRLRVSRGCSECNRRTALGRLRRGTYARRIAAAKCPSLGVFLDSLCVPERDCPARLLG